MSLRALAWEPCSLWDVLREHDKNWGDSHQRQNFLMSASSETTRVLFQVLNTLCNIGTTTSHLPIKKQFSSRIWNIILNKSHQDRNSRTLSIGFTRECQISESSPPHRLGVSPLTRANEDRDPGNAQWLWFHFRMFCWDIWHWQQQTVHSAFSPLSLPVNACIHRSRPILPSPSPHPARFHYHIFPTSQSNCYNQAHLPQNGRPSHGPSSFFLIYSSGFSCLSILLKRN